MSDYELMLICAMRYALGRKSYIADFVATQIKFEIPKLSKSCKKTMIDDIREQEHFGYGDEEVWLELLERLKRAL